jgi:hypothetical protein
MDAIQHVGKSEVWVQQEVLFFLCSDGPDVLSLEDLTRSALGDVRIVYPGPMDVVLRSQRDERPKLFLRSALPSCRSAV